MSPDPAAQLGLAKTDAHAGAVTASGSGVKIWTRHTIVLNAQVWSVHHPKLDQATSDLAPSEITERQATSAKLDKRQAVGYYEIRKEGSMDNKTISIADAVERMITAINIVTGDDGSRSKRAVVTFIELLKMNKKDYAKQQKFYG